MVAGAELSAPAFFLPDVNLPQRDVWRTLAPMIFDFRLRVFHTVAQRLSFTRAAADLFITQPAVTKHIKELEQQLNVQLFKRNGSSITLTGAGKILLQYADRIIQLYAEMETELAQLNNMESGILHIGASTTVAQTILPKILALFKKTYPAVNFLRLRRPIQM